MGSGIYCFGGNCSKDPREDSSSVFAGGTAGSSWRGFQRKKRHFMEASEGLRNSQKGEVAWLEHKGYAYTEVEVDISKRL